MDTSGTTVRRRHRPRAADASPSERVPLIRDDHYLQPLDDHDDHAAPPASNTGSNWSAWSWLEYLYSLLPSWEAFVSLLRVAPRQPFVIPPEMQGSHGAWLAGVVRLKGTRRTRGSLQGVHQRALLVSLVAEGVPDLSHTRMVPQR